jgi:isopentenyl-diphosphate delta-isomerase
MSKYKNTDIVTLVDVKGNVRGYAEKIDAHLRGELHLAFSLMITRKREGKSEYLLQRRAKGKYHSGGLWANTCCSHPLPSESVEVAAKRRVFEELGVKGLTKVSTIGQIYYKHTLDNNMIEHEYDNIVIAEVEHIQCEPNSCEVMAVKWWKEHEIDRCLEHSSEIFSAWFEQVFTYIKNHEPACT